MTNAATNLKHAHCKQGNLEFETGSNSSSSENLATT